MEILDYLHSQHYQSDKYVPRKTSIPELGDINLFGVRGAGKTSIILEYLETFDEESKLYIDCEDPNLIFNELTPHSLQQYLNEHNISLLILDHYDPSLLEYFPDVERLIILSRIALTDIRFEKIELFPLDYEEFLGFENSVTATNVFNHFLKAGTLPAIARSHRFTLYPLKLFWQSRFSIAEQNLLLILAQHHTKHLTTYQIYNLAKERFKVSKDWLYKTVKDFRDEKLIFFINDRYQKGGKKMILFDFAFAKYLTTGQPFIIQFDTMIALSLIKHGIKFETLGIHGYITYDNELIIPAPFESEESLWAKSQTKFSLYKQYKVKKITIVTVANSYEYDIEKLHFEALPFYEWTVLHDEEED